MEVLKQIPGSNDTKTTVGLYTGATVGVLIWGANTYYFTPNLLPVVPAEQAAFLVTIITGLVQYIKSERDAN